MDEIVLVTDLGLMQFSLRNGDVYTRVDAFYQSKKPAQPKPKPLLYLCQLVHKKTVEKLNPFDDSPMYDLLTVQSASIQTSTTHSENGGKTEQYRVIARYSFVDEVDSHS